MTSETAAAFSCANWFLITDMNPLPSTEAKALLGLLTFNLSFFHEIHCVGVYVLSGESEHTGNKGAPHEGKIGVMKTTSGSQFPKMLHGSSFLITSQHLGS